MTEHECEFCDEQFKTKTKLGTHKLLNHNDELDSSDISVNVTINEHEPTENRHEKGEQFGYE